MKGDYQQHMWRKKHLQKNLLMSTHNYYPKKSKTFLKEMPTSAGDSYNILFWWLHRSSVPKPERDPRRATRHHVGIMGIFVSNKNIPIAPRWRLTRHWSNSDLVDQFAVYLFRGHVYKNNPGSL